jgi:hypothetical protein
MAVPGFSQSPPAGSCSPGSSSSNGQHPLVYTSAITSLFSESQIRQHHLIVLFSSWAQDWLTRIGTCDLGAVLIQLKESLKTRNAKAQGNARGFGDLF